MNINWYVKLLKQKREKRVKEWASSAGPPHVTVLLGDDPNTIGFWRFSDAIIRIRAMNNGDYDPIGRMELSNAEVQAIIATNSKKPIDGD